MSPARKPGGDDDLSLVRWAAELEAAATIARQLAGTAFLPDTLKRYHLDEHGNPLNGKDNRPYRLDVDATTATAAAAILTGQELGLKPMAALRSIAVINNTPALNALTLRAILQSAGHDIWIAESTATRAVVRARRAGTDEIQQSIWTTDRAKQLGLYPGTERSNWRRQPQAMLVARSTAEAARWIAADAILGIPLIAEELIDQLVSDADARPAIEAAAADGQRVAVPKPRTAQRKTPRALPALPSGTPAGSTEPPEVGPDEPEPISKQQLAQLHTAIRDLGWTRETAMPKIAEWIGRKIKKTTELTFAEAHTVLDNLASLRKIAAGDDDHGDAPPPDQEPQ
jgi:hypothetical protein